MLNEGTEKYSAEEFNNQLEKLGSTLSINVQTESIKSYVQSLTKNLPATLALLEDKLYHPKFDKEDFDRLQKQQLEGIANQNTQPVAIANKAYNRLLYGNQDIRALPVIGTDATVRQITFDDVKNFYRKNFSPSITNLAIVGDVEQATILPQLAFLQKWEAKPVTLPTLQASRTIDKTRIYLVDKEKAAQSEIRIGYLTDIPFDATGEYYKAGIANYILGGAFNSRINLNLREDKGYTYGAFSYFSSTHTPGPYTAQAGVKANTTDSSIVEFVKEITNYTKDGITDAELNFVKSSIGQYDALKYETPGQKAAFLNQIIEYNLPEDFVEKQNSILQNITKAEIDALAKKRLPIDKMLITVVGDAALVKPGLQKLGYEVVELDMEGQPLPPPRSTVNEQSGGSSAQGRPTTPAPPMEEKKTKAKKSKR